MSKGSSRRPLKTDKETFEANWDAIFKVQKDPNHKARQTMPHKDKREKFLSEAQISEAAKAIKNYNNKRKNEKQKKRGEI